MEKVRVKEEGEMTMKKSITLTILPNAKIRTPPN
jgi:hypothetical protein